MTKDEAKAQLVAAWRAKDGPQIAAVLRSGVLTQREEAECIVVAQGPGR